MRVRLRQRKLRRASFGMPGQPMRHPRTNILLFQYMVTVTSVFVHCHVNSTNNMVTVIKNTLLSVYGYCEDNILLFSTCLLKVLGVMWHCQVSSAGVCSKIALVTKAMRWCVILRRSAWYLGKLVAKAM